METVQFGTLVENFNDMLSKAKRHIFNIRHQYLQYRYLRSQLDHCSCMLHIDFAENYICQYNREIQSVHFSGSHCQTTMHTGASEMTYIVSSGALNSTHSLFYMWASLHSNLFVHSWILDHMSQWLLGVFGTRVEDVVRMLSKCDKYSCFQ